MDRQDNGSSGTSVNDASFENAEEPPGSGEKRHPFWNHVTTEQWNDWRWQMQNAIRTTRQVSELLSLAPQEIPALEQLETQYKLAIPPYYFSLIDPADPNDPIRLQSVPSVAEMAANEGQELEDPLEEDKDSPVPGLTHRYPDRVLMVTTHVCSMYCRFCTRKRVTMDRSGWDAPSRNDQRMVQYVKDHKEVHDVIVSGGDPLSLPVSKLSWLVNELSAIDHVSVIRLGTRVPVTLPQRIFDPELVKLLGDAEKIWIQTHFNHPSEITPASTKAIRLLVNAGMPVNNHAVLLKGVNDSVPTMRALMRGLLRIKVRPYYLFHCDPVVGAGHFRTSVWKGLEIMEGLRGHVSGLGVPTYVVDGLHGAGKIPMMPNYLVSASEEAVILRNYEGLIFRYAPEHNEEPQRQKYESLGVSSLLGGSGTALVPEGNRRLARRTARAEEAAHVAEATPVVLPVVQPSDMPLANGVAAPDLVASANGNGVMHANGNGKANGRSKSNGIAAKNGVAKLNGVAKADGAIAGGDNGQTKTVKTPAASNGATGHAKAVDGSASKPANVGEASTKKPPVHGHRVHAAGKNGLAAKKPLDRPKSVVGLNGPNGHATHAPKALAAKRVSRMSGAPRPTKVARAKAVPQRKSAAKLAARRSPKDK